MDKPLIYTWLHPHFIEFEDIPAMASKLSGKTSVAVVSTHSSWRGSTGKSALWLQRPDGPWLTSCVDELGQHGIPVQPRVFGGGWKNRWGSSKRVIPVPAQYNAANRTDGRQTKDDWLDLFNPEVHPFVWNMVEDFFEKNYVHIPVLDPTLHLDGMRMTHFVNGWQGTGMTVAEGQAIINSLVDGITKLLPTGWGLAYTCSSVKKSNDETGRDPVDLLKSGTIDWIKILNYLDPASVRIERVKAWDSDPEWQALAATLCWPGIGTDPSLDGDYVPGQNESQINEAWVRGEVLTVLDEYSSLCLFVYGDGKDGFPPRMSDEIIAALPDAAPAMDDVDDCGDTVLNIEAPGNVVVNVNR